MSELHNDDKNHNILETLIIFLSQSLLVKFLTKRKFQFHHCEGKIVLKKVTNSVNSQTNIKSSGNDSVTTKFYKHLSNELTFNVYQ